MRGSYTYRGERWVGWVVNLRVQAISAMKNAVWSNTSCSGIRDFKVKTIENDSLNPKINVLGDSNGGRGEVENFPFL